MELQLRHRTQPSLDISGAYLDGNVADWLAEISYWAIDPLSLKAYLVPKGIADNGCKGIFVLFNGVIPQKRLIRHPYAAVSEGFFIPADARLFPEISLLELDALKLWDIQVFHPHVGLVGFEYGDARALSTFIEMPTEEEQLWTSVWPNLPAEPLLRMVSLEPIDGFDTIDLLKSLIETKPLDEIPSLDEQEGKRFPRLRQLLRPLINLGLWILLILAFIGKFLLKIINFLFPSAISSISKMARPSLLQRLDAWINKKIDSLEKQRDTELNRLVKMFDKDKDMALQYAIPLNNLYQERGKALPSAKLTRRHLNFNFGNFGTGAATDVWDIGNYRWVLQEKYEKAATQAIENGDYKRAAYIYAHLLGDFFRAAKTLEEGKHYREASAIYKDHLKNNLRAAECLQRGGLLNEAIELYIDLEHYETVGNLYLELGQEEKASKYFEEVVTRSLNLRDHLKAAEIVETKFDDLERAQGILLEGWLHQNKAERCLSRYFEITGARALPLIDSVKQFHQAYVSRTRATDFLYVLAELAANTEQIAFKQESLTICYQIIHEQSSHGDFSALKMLGRFMPEDRLIDQDIHRFTIKQKQVRRRQADHLIQLEIGTTWKDFCAFHDQLLAIGMKGVQLQLLRMNWDAKIDYSLLTNVGGDLAPLFVADAGLSDDVLVISPEIFNQRKHLQHSQFFERPVTVHQVNWIPPATVGANIDSNGNLSMLQLRGEQLLLETHDLGGKQLSSLACTLDGYLINANELALGYSRLYWRKEHLYFAAKDALVRIDDIGAVQILAMESLVHSFSVSGVHAALKIAILTVEGCVIVTPTLREMDISIPLFAGELSAHLVQLLPNNYLVLASAQKAQVYELGSKKAELLFEVITDHHIEQIIPVPKRNHFALFGADNRISIFVIPTD